jgi:hypothetical protein
MNRSLFTVLAAALLLPASALANPISPLNCDFDGDGYDDLAMGSTGESVGNAIGAGAVNVIYGAPAGLSATSDQIFQQGAGGIEGLPETGDAFGAALTCGDFDADGYDDLVIGVPQESVGNINNAGAVQVIYGSPFGVWPTDDQLWTQDSAGMLDTCESGDRFGTAVVAGDFDNDGYDDLAIGIPGEDVGTIGNAGAVAILYGNYGGLYATGNVLFHEDTSGVPGLAESGDLFGASLTVGDFDHDRYDDLAIGSPGEDVIGPDPDDASTDINLSTVGSVHVLYGMNSGLSTWASQLWDPGTSGVTGTVEQYERFGASLAAGDFDNDGFDDLAIGAPGESVGALSNAGAVNVLYGAGTGLTATDDQIWYQGLVQGGAESRDRFGEAVVAGDFDSDGYDDLAVGAPGEGVGSERGAGAIHLILGSNIGLDDFGNQIWYQDQANILDDSEAGDLFGGTLSLGDYDGDGFADLAIGVPGESVGSVAGVGLTHVMYGNVAGLGTLGNQIWHQGVANVEGAMEANDRTGAVLMSTGVYRMPYANNTSVVVTNDAWTHRPYGRIDMSGTGGTGSYTIAAAAAGVVVAVVDFNAEPTDNNNYIWIAHPNGEWTKYSHIATGTATLFGISVGDIVFAGQPLGVESDVGQASGDHLHFEVAVPNDSANALDSGGYIRGDNRIPQICGVDGNVLIGGATYTATGC